MQKRLLKILSVLFILIFIFSAFPFSVSAADPGLMNVSGVISDLEKFGVDIEDYQKDIEAEHCRMLKFLEYGYDYYGGTSDYGLYVYIWNPSGKEIDIDSGHNYIQMQGLYSAGTKETGFYKFNLKHISHSTLEGYEYVFYKFRVEDVKKFCLKLEKSIRQYDISGVELQFEGDTNGTDFKVGGVYSFSDYMPYHGPEKSAESELKCYIRGRITVDLSLNPVSWKTNTSDKGVGYQYEVFGVYFAVPDDIIRDYGNKDDVTKGLVEVYGSYEEYKVNGLVTQYDDVYEQAMLYVHAKPENEEVPFGFSVGCEFSSLLSHYIGGKAYNNDWIGVQAHKQYEKIEYICTAFNTDKEDFSTILTDELFEQLYVSGGDGFYVMDDVDEGRTKGFQYYTVSTEDGKLNNQIASFASNHSKFVSWLRGEGDLYDEDESYSAIYPIEVVSDSDFLIDNIILSDAAIANKLFIQESEVDGLKSFVASSTLKDKTTYLMRFAVRDYYCDDIYFRADGWGNNYNFDDGNYYFEKTVFHNFDVISLTYENAYSERTVIPVVCSPINVGGTITPPADGENPNTEPSVTVKDIVTGCKDLAIGWKLVSFLLIAVFISWFLRLFGISFKDIIIFLTAPFRLLGKGIKSIGKKRSDKKKKKEAEKKKKKSE